MYVPKVRLELSSTPPGFSFSKTPSALSIKTQAPLLEISSPAAVLHIDQTLPREEAGFRTMLAFARYTAEQARQDVRQAAEEYAQAGNRLAQIQLPQSGIVELAKAKLFRQPEEFNIQAVPAIPPAIWAEVSPVSVKIIPGNLSLQFAPAVFQYRFQYGSIKGRLAPEGNSFDLTV